MNIDVKGQTLRVTGVSQLGASNANEFRDLVRDAFSGEPRDIALDLSETTYLDSCGLGALVALHKSAASRKGTLRLLNPPPPVRQILDLTRMSSIFELVKR